MRAASAAPAIVRRTVVDSTQTVAFDLAARGAPDGSVVVADFQTAGRGRRGRSWQAAPGSALLLSLVLRPRLLPDALPALSLATAVAVAEAIRATAGADARLKWPNDVLVGERKVAGILLEARHEPDVVVVAGIGINLRPDAIPPALAARATCLGAGVDREALLRAVLAAVDRWRRRLEAEGFEPVRARWLALSDAVGRRVERDGVAGLVVGLDADGALLVEDAGGVQRVRAGEVGWGPPGEDVDAARH